MKVVNESLIGQYKNFVSRFIFLFFFFCTKANWTGKHKLANTVKRGKCVFSSLVIETEQTQNETLRTLTRSLFKLTKCGSSSSVNIYNSNGAQYLFSPSSWYHGSVIHYPRCLIFYVWINDNDKEACIFLNKSVRNYVYFTVFLTYIFCIFSYFCECTWYVFPLKVMEGSKEMGEKGIGKAIRNLMYKGELLKLQILFPFE